MTSQDCPMLYLHDSSELLDHNYASSLGTVNSPALGKPKKSMQQATHSIILSESHSRLN